jgi:repressor LexA
MKLCDPPDPDDGDLTPRRRRIVQVIDESVRLNGYSPSLREIGSAVGLASTSSVSFQLSKLQEKGLVSREPRRPRTTKIRPRPGQACEPDEARQSGDGKAGVHDLAWVQQLDNKIAAGTPVTADQRLGDVMPLPRELVGYGDLMMLKVAGESMTGAAITDGDWVVVRRAPDAENGEIVAAMLDSSCGDGAEATVKTLRKHDGHVWLMPHNPAYTPIPGDKATIIGKVVAVLRTV